MNRTGILIIFSLVVQAELLVLPMVFWPWTRVPFELPRVWYVLGWTEVLAIMTIVTLWKRRAQTIDEGILRVVLALVAVSWLASIAGADWQKSLLGNFYRSDGLITLVGLAGLSLCIALCLPKGVYNRTLGAIALGSTLTSMWALADGYRWYVLKDPTVWQWAGAIGVSFGQPKFLTGYLLVTLPFLFHFATSSNRSLLRTLWRIALGAQAVALLLTKSWAATLGLILVVFGWFALRYRRKVTLRRKWFLLILFLLLVITFILLWHKTTSLPYQINAESRDRIIMKGLLAWTHRPILGWGWANFDYAFRSVDWPYTFYHDVYVDKAHGNLLEMLVTTGIVGFGVYLTLLWRVFRKLKSSNDHFSRTILLVFFTYLYHSQTNVTSIAEEVIFWFIVGVAGQNKKN